jgi:type IV pilus assembly protein PilA
MDCGLKQTICNLKTTIKGNIVMKTTMKKMQKGFSLVELMVVIAIIAILAAVAIPMYSNYTTRAKLSSELSAIGGVKAEVSEAISNNGGSTAGITIAATSLPANVTVGQTNGEIIINTTDTVSGSTLILTPTATNGALTWVCSSTVLSSSEAPSNCATA